MIEIAPSILSADISKLREQIEEVEKAGAHYIHIDVMDGHFVPNLTFGPIIVETVRKITNLPLDVHLMIENPGLYIGNYVDSGADILTVHLEACTHLDRVIQRIKEYGIKAGVAINPSTPEKSLEYVINDLDLVLVMSVNPGFGGQKLIRNVLPKFKWLREQNPNLILEIDGGVSPETAPEIAKAGANLLVAGNAVFKQSNIGRAVKTILSAANSIFA